MSKKDIIRSDILSDLNAKSDEDLVKIFKQGLPGFRGNHAQMQQCAQLIHTRFKKAHKSRLPFLGFRYEDGDFNEFCQQKMDITGRQVRRIVALLKEPNPPTPPLEGKEVEIAEQLEQRLIERGSKSWPAVLVSCRWRPWAPKSKSEKKHWPEGIRNRYRVALYLTSTQVESLQWTEERVRPEEKS